MAKPIIIYKNDLKNRDKMMDMTDVEFADEETEKLCDVDVDTVDYRVKECVADSEACFETKVNKEVKHTLDLKHLNLTNIPSLSSSMFKTVRNLFICHNNLKKLPSMQMFYNLEVLDCGHNNITTIDELPDTLIELNCESNQITDLSNLSKYKIDRLRCSYNKLTSLPPLTLSILDCSHNNLTDLPMLPNLRKLICSHNKLKEINSFPQLEYLDCSDNSLISIEQNDAITELFCNNNKLPDLPKLNSLQILDCSNNTMKQIHYYPHLLELLCNYNGIDIATKYKEVLDDHKVYHDKYLFVRFHQDISV